MNYNVAMVELVKALTNVHDHFLRQCYSQSIVLWKFVGFDFLIPELHLLQEFDDLDVLGLLSGLSLRHLLIPKVLKSKLLNFLRSFPVEAEIDRTR